MDIASRPSRVSVLRLLSLALAAAFVFVVLSLLLGFGTSGARADDGDTGGVLGGVTGVVDSTVDAAGDVVGGTSAAATTVVAPVVAEVVDATPPPVQSAVETVAAPVVGAVVQTAETVVEPVAQLADAGAVSAVVDPVAATVEAVPIVGDVVAVAGVPDALRGTAGTADGALGGVVDSAGGLVSTVQETGQAIGGRLPIASVPDAPIIGAVTDASAPTASTPHSLAITMWTAAQLKGLAHVAAFFLSGPPAGPLTGVAPATLGAAGAVLGGLLTSALLLGACAPVGGSSAGPGGAGPGALALASVSPLVAHRAWVRRRGRTDDETPAAPTFDTDVSPD